MLQKSGIFAYGFVGLNRADVQLRYTSGVVQSSLTRDQYATVSRDQAETACPFPDRYEPTNTQP